MSQPDLIFAGAHLNLMKRDGWEYVTRAVSGAVIILPILPDGKLVLISEFRKPLQKRVLGLPAGLVGDKNLGEGIFDGARRELLEETGYLAGYLKLVASDSPSSSGLTDESFDLFIARDLTRIHCGGGDESEDIRVVKTLPTAVDLRKLFSDYRDSGHVIDPKIFMALFLAEYGVM